MRITQKRLQYASAYKVEVPRVERGFMEFLGETGIAPIQVGYTVPVCCQCVSLRKPLSVHTAALLFSMTIPITPVSLCYHFC